MKLYYFTTREYGLEAITHRRLKIARIGELNDPFEFLGIALERENQGVLNNWKETMDGRYGIISMSTEWSHPMLWGHYADKHQGVALGFDVPAGAVKKIEYDDRRPTLADLGLTTLQDFPEEKMTKYVLYKKFNAWSYESEYRFFLSLDKKDPKTNHYFACFSNNMVLAQVVVGDRCKLSRNALAQTLGDLSSSVETFKTRPSNTKFEMVKNESWR